MDATEGFFHRPIGFMKTCFSSKNGTPRQPSVSSLSKGELKIMKTVFNNPEHSVEGLAQYSHLWIIFVFHLNENKGAKAKVKPPRMNGAKTGVFSTRTPHRPNPIGLTLAKLERVGKDMIYLSGLDIVDGTPILDVKPYIPLYDAPSSQEEGEEKSPTVVNSDATVTKNGAQTPPSDSSTQNECGELTLPESDNFFKEDVESESLKDGGNKPEIPEWITKPPIATLQVAFSNRAKDNLDKFKFYNSTKKRSGNQCDEWTLKHINANSLQQAITDILTADPRSSYRRKKCSDRLYYFTLDNAHITAWFDDTVTPNCVEVLRVVPQAHVEYRPQNTCTENQ